MTDVNGDVTPYAPDPNATPGLAPSNTSTGTDGERSASLSAEERRSAGLLNDGDTIVPGHAKNDKLEAKGTEIRTADGDTQAGPGRALFKE